MTSTRVLRATWQTSYKPWQMLKLQSHCHWQQPKSPALLRELSQQRLPPNGMANSGTIFQNRGGPVEPTVPPSWLSKVNSRSKYLVSWNPAAAIVNAVNKFTVVTCLLTKIVGESFLLWSSIWTGATERSTLPVWRSWLTRKGKRVITELCEVPSEERRHQIGTVQKYVLMFWALGNGRYRTKLAEQGWGWHDSSEKSLSASNELLNRKL